MRKLRIDQYFSCLLIVVVAWWLPQAVWAQAGGGAQEVRYAPVALPPLRQPAPLPLQAGGVLSETDLATISATSIYVMDRDSGAVLYQVAGDAPRYPASTAKLMTALVARRVFSLNDSITIQEEAFTTGTTMKLQLGETLTVRQLLAGLLIPSGNDAAFALANHHPGGYAGFVKDMNAMGKELHLTNTVFRNPSGLDSDTQTSTAHDLALLSAAVMKDPLLRQLVGTKSTTLTDVTGQITHQVTSTQELLGTVDGVVGVKTGTTEFAGENLITAVDRDGHEVIIVMLGSKHRFDETRQLIEWVFQNFEWLDWPSLKNKLSTQDVSTQLP